MARVTLIVLLALSAGCATAPVRESRPRSVPSAPGNVRTASASVPRKALYRSPIRRPLITTLVGAWDGALIATAASIITAGAVCEFSSGCACRGRALENSVRVGAFIVERGWVTVDEADRKIP